MGTIAAAQAVCCAITVRGCALGKLYLKEFVSKKLYLGKDVPWGKVEIVSKDSPLVRSSTVSRHDWRATVYQSPNQPTTITKPFRQHSLCMNESSSKALIPY